MLMSQATSQATSIMHSILTTLSLRSWRLPLAIFGVGSAIACQSVSSTPGGSLSDAASPPSGDATPRMGPDAGGFSFPTADARPGSDAGPVSDAGPGSDAGARPDVGVDCPTVSVTAELVEPRLYLRGEAAEIRYDAPAGYDIEGAASAGGRLNPRNDGRIYYAPGDKEPGDLAWPRWTGPVTVEIVAVDPTTGCRVGTSVEVDVAGDVLHGDARHGRLGAYGSGGQVLGIVSQVSDRGIRWLTQVPPADDFEGGVAALVWSPDGEPGELVLLDRDGAPLDVEFEMTNFAGDPLYAAGQPPQRLMALDGVLMADNATQCQVHQWDLGGAWLGAIDYPCDPASGRRSVGFAVFDGAPIAGIESYPADLYNSAGELVLAVTNERLRGLVPGTGRDIAIITGTVDGRLWAYDMAGRQIANEPSGRLVHYMTRFLDGYLNVDIYVGVVQRRRDLTVVDIHGQWNEEGVSLGLDERGGLVWLDDGRWRPERD